MNQTWQPWGKVHLPSCLLYAAETTAVVLRQISVLRKYNHEIASLIMTIWKHFSRFCEIRLGKVTLFILSQNCDALKISPHVVHVP